jgi:ElaB/YqjD/DUF883 family membrane-anchored ribosome-binding protein
MNTQTTDSPIAPPVQAVLDLFSSDLAGVRFPDMDREVLEEAARRAHEAAAEQARLEAQLQAAREALQESQDALLQKCQRALAYARVFAEDDPELGRKLEAVALPRGRGKAALSGGPPEGEARVERRRGRRTAAQGGAGLFLEGTSETPLAAEASP